MEFALILLVILVIAAIVSGFVQIRNEKKQWNDGVCKKTGNPWEFFDMDSQGHSGYKSYYTGSKEYEVFWSFRMR